MEQSKARCISSPTRLSHLRHRPWWNESDRSTIHWCSKGGRDTCWLCSIGAGAAPVHDTWSPTWEAFDVLGTGLDFHGVPATLEAAVEARRTMHEREPRQLIVTHPDDRDGEWWRKAGERAGLPDLRFYGAAEGGPPCLCARLLDSGADRPFPAECLRDGSTRPVAERGCRSIDSSEPKLRRQCTASTAWAIKRMVDRAPHAVALIVHAPMEQRPSEVTFRR